MLVKSPPAYQQAGSPLFAKEGDKCSVVFLEIINEGLPTMITNH
jgi:hypothetical protein